MTIKGKEIKLLDHGIIKVIDIMGDDAAIVEAARTSYGDGTTSTRPDHELINYLLRHQHTTPFEMCEIKMFMRLPIFVARQFIRHRTASVNEYSMRYSAPKDLFYVPDPEHLQPQSGTNKQGRAGEIANNDKQKIMALIDHANKRSFQTYETLAKPGTPQSEEPGSLRDATWVFDEEYPGLARELARLPITVSAYTQWYWKIDLKNLMGFLRLRMDSHAQYEIRVYADAIGELVKEWLPATWNAFEEYIFHAQTFSRKEQKYLQQAVFRSGIAVFAPPEGDVPEGFSAGEYREFRDKIQKIHNLK